MQQETLTIDVDALIAAEYDALRARIEETLVPLLVRRALMRASSAHASVEGGKRDAAAVPEPKRRAPAPRVGAPTAQLVVDALWDAPRYRMRGPDLTQLVIRYGYGRDAAEKTKGRLRKLGILHREDGTGFWSLTPEFLENGAEIRVSGEPSPESVNRTREALSILDVLSEAGEDGLPGEHLIKAVEQRGIAPAEAATVRRCLRRDRYVGFDQGGGNLWRITSAGAAHLRSLRSGVASDLH